MYGIKHDLNYCPNVDALNLENPEHMFKQMNFLSDYARDGKELFLKDVMRCDNNFFYSLDNFE